MLAGETLVEIRRGDEPKRHLGTKYAEKPLRAKAARPPQRRSELLGVPVVRPKEPGGFVSRDGEAVSFPVDGPGKVRIRWARVGVEHLAPRVVAVYRDGDRPADIAPKVRPFGGQQLLEGVAKRSELIVSDGLFKAVARLARGSKGADNLFVSSIIDDRTDLLQPRQHRPGSLGLGDVLVGNADAHAECLDTGRNSRDTPLLAQTPSTA